ncbi:MAG: hypothetical protein P4M09_01045 [Devosia sp.]|nr:hypothetical protein [Devosia sp.]
MDLVARGDPVFLRRDEAKLAAHVVAVTDAIYASARSGQKLWIKTP